MGECPLQPLIPLFLVLGGLSGLVKNVLLITENIVKQKSSTISSRIRHPKLLIRIWRVGNFLFNLFLFAWVIGGSYYVYSIYREVVTTDYSTCNVILYKFAFSIVTCSYVILVLVFTCTFVIAGASLRRMKTHTTPPQTRENGQNAASADGTRSEADGELENVVSVEYSERGFEVEGVAGEGVVSDVETQEGGGGGGGGGGTGREEEDSFPPTSSAVVRESLDVSAMADMDQQAVSTGNLTSHRPQSSELRLAVHSSEQQLRPDMQQQYHGPRLARSLMRFESCPYPSYPLRHASFGSNDSGLLSSQSAYASRFKPMAGPISFSQFLSQTQKNANCPHSSFRSLCESYDMDLRRCSLGLPRNSSFREDGTGSNRSSLYNTIHSDGCSITAV